MGMPRLINDKRRNFAIKCIIFAILICTIVLIAKYKISTINEQWRSNGREILDALQEKCDWLNISMNQLYDTNHLETILNGIAQRQENKENIIQAQIDLVCKTRKNEFRNETTNLANKCTEIYAELTDVQHKLSVLSGQGRNIMMQLRKSADSRIGKTLNEIRSEAEQSCMTLRQICDRNIVISIRYQEAISECKRIIGLIATNKSGDNEWKHFEKQYDDYIKWKKTVEDLLNHFDELEHTLQDNFKILNSIPIDHKYIQDVSQEQINEELKVLTPIIEMERELYDNFVKRLNSELEKRNLIIQKVFDSITRLKEQHGNFVDAEHVASAHRIIDLFQDSYHSSQENVNRQWQVIQANILKAKRTKETATKTHISLLKNSDEVSDELMMQKFNNTMLCVRELQMTRNELVNNIEMLKDNVTKKLSLATESVDEMNNLLKSVEQSLPDLSVEWRKINDDINDIQKQKQIIEEKIANIKNEIVYYRDNGVQGEKDLLLVMYNETQNALEEMKTINVSEQPCTNGIELIKLQDQRDEMNKHLTKAKDKFQHLVNERDNALKLGKVCKIRYIPFSHSMMTSQLHEAYKNTQTYNENVVCHFDLSLDLPEGGYHKVKIRFWKDKKSLYKISRGKDHFVVINYKVTGIQNKSDALKCLDKTNKSGGESTERWPSIEIYSVFESGINDIDLDLSFKAVDIKDTPLYDGEWQFQYEETKGFFNSDKNIRDNFFMEVLIDGNVAKLLMRVKEQ